MKQVIENSRGICVVESTLSDGSSVFDIVIERTILKMPDNEAAISAFNEIVFQFTLAIDIDNRTERKRIGLDY